MEGRVCDDVAETGVKVEALDVVLKVRRGKRCMSVE